MLLSEPIQSVVIVPTSAAAAFALFAEELGRWWPREYTWGQDALVRIGIEPRVGGRCYEIGPHDFHSDWGRVLLWELPHRLVLAWQISPDRAPEPNPSKASEVEVRFEYLDESQTQVVLEHRAFDRHGVGGASYREAMASAQGWPFILQRYAEAAR